MRTRALNQWERLLLMRSGSSTALTRSTVAPEESAVVFNTAYLAAEPATHSVGRYSFDLATGYSFKILNVPSAKY